MSPLSAGAGHLMLAVIPVLGSLIALGYSVFLWVRSASGSTARAWRCSRAFCP